MRLSMKRLRVMETGRVERLGVMEGVEIQKLELGGNEQ